MYTEEALIKCSAKHGRKPVPRAVKINVFGVDVHEGVPYYTPLKAKSPETPLQATVSHCLKLRWSEGVLLEGIAIEPHTSGASTAHAQNIDNLLPFDATAPVVMDLLAEVEQTPRSEELRRALACIGKMSRKPQHRRGFLAPLDEPAHRINPASRAKPSVVDYFLDSNTTNTDLAKTLIDIGNRLEALNPQKHLKRTLACYQLADAFTLQGEVIDF